MTLKTIRRSMAFRNDEITSLSSPGASIEDFNITYGSNPRHVTIDATRTRDMLSLRFELPGFKYDARKNRLWKPSAGTQATLVLPPQHIAETIWQEGVEDAKASRLAAPETRLVFTLPAGSDTIQMKIDDIFKVIAKGTPKVSPRASSSLDNDLAAQLALLEVEDWSTYTAADLERRLKEIIAPPAADETALQLIGKISLSTSEKARWQFNGAPPWSRNWGRAPRLDAETALHTIRLTNGAEAGLRALHSRRFDSTDGKTLHTGLVSDADLKRAGDQVELEKLMALLPLHHRDLVAQTSIPGLPALLALNEDGTPKKSKTGLPNSRVVSPGFDIGYVDKAKDVGIALTQPYDRAKIALTGQGATIDLRYAGEPPLLKLAGAVVKDYRGFNVEVSDYLTSLGMDWKVETAEKGYLFPLGIRCSRVSLVSRSVVDKEVDGEGKRISRANKITFLKMSGEPKLVNGPYCPFEGRWLPANSIRMRTLVTPPLVKGDNYLDQAVGDFAMFWPQVEDENGNATDFEFEWETDDGLARCNLLFVLNEYVVDAGLMRELARKYNQLTAIRPQDLASPEEKLTLARRTAHFAGTRHRYAASEQRSGANLVPGQDERDRGQTSFETQSWILSASGRIDETKYDPATLRLPTLDEQDFTMDGRMEGASQPPFFPYMRCANIRVQSADLMMGTGSGAIAVDYHPLYVIKGFGNAKEKAQAGKAEIFLRTIGGNAELDAAKSANRSGGVASFAAPIAALSRKVGIIGGQKIAGAMPGEKQYDFSEAEGGQFAANQFLKGTPGNAALDRVDTSFSLVLGSLDLVKLGKKLIDNPDVPKLLQQVELAPKVEEQFQRGAKALDDKLYGRNGLAEDIATRIKALDFGAPGPADLLGNYWYTLKDMGFVKDPNRDPNPPFRKKVAAIIDTGSGSTAEDVVAFVKAVESFGDETAAFVQNPVPEKVLDAIRKVEKLIEQAANGQLAKAIWNDHLHDLVKAKLGTAFDDFLQANPDLVKLLFGRAVTAEDLKNDPDGIFDGTGKRLYGGSFKTLRQNLSLLFGLVGQLQLPVISLPGQTEIDAIVHDAFLTIADQINAHAAPAAAISKDLCDPAVQRELAQMVRGELAALVTGALAQVRIESVDDLLRTLENRRSRIRRESSARLKAIIEDFLKDANQLSADQKKKAADDLEEWLQGKVLQPFVFVLLDDAFALVSDVVEDPRTIHGRLLADTTDAVLSLYDQSAIHSHVQQAQDLEEQLRAGIVALVDTITGEGSELSARLIEIRGKLAAWSAPDGLSWPDNVLRDDLLALIGGPAEDTGLIGQQKKLQDLRDEIRTLADTTISQPLLEKVVEALRLRATGVQVIAQVAMRIFAFQSGKPDAAVPTADVPTDIVPDLAALAKLYLPLADLTKYTSIEDAVDQIEVQLAAVGPAGKETSERITKSFSALQQGATALQARLDANPDARTLSSLLADEAPKLLAHVDTSLVGDLAQFYTFPAKLFAQFDAASKQAIARLWIVGTPVLKQAIAALSGVAATAKGTVAEIRNGPLASYVEYILGRGELQNVENALGPLEAACSKADTLLGKVPNTPDGVRDALDAVVRAIVDAMRALRDVLDKIEIRNGKQILDNIVSALLADARRAVEELVRELLPSKLTANYEWTTNLCDVAAGYEAISFCPGGLDMGTQAFGHSSALDCNGDNDCNKDDIHLATRARFEMDLFERKLTSEISGRVAPMRIVFPTPSFHMATIILKETTFRSVDGKAPDFNVRIHDVIMGDALKFLHPLQAWMAPGKSGIYLESSAKQIKIGFRYDAGIINLGAVRFLNLVFDVSARLPFTGSKATFGFKISDAEWPFLVVSEPYGGGGYLDLNVYADGKLQSMALYAFFGAVSQVQFGPIKASGRIVCGIYVEQKAGTGGKELGAFFEVAGRASVACFSLSLHFIVRLAQKGKDLFGKAELTITIKRGFVKFEFKAKADQRIKGKGSGSKALAPEAALAIVEGTAIDANDPTVTVELPNKMNNWRSYKGLFA
ncbi:MAG: hypothetical protein EOP62_18430 [Sphingomonadales bacterium]|nr:MAG: hypothetical protein EOP62_18430 [Sphingomonadales bacterium]